MLWSDFGFMAQNILDQYELSVATRGRSVNEVVVQETYRFFDRSATVAGLSPGTVYNVMMSGNFFGNIQGLNSSILVTTLESGESVFMYVALTLPAAIGTKCYCKHVVCIR